MKRQLKQIISFVLMIAMVLTMSSVSNLGREIVKASDAVKLYFELPDGTSAADWAVNAWSDVTVEGDKEHAFRPSAWGDGAVFPTLLTDEALSGWGYVTVSGTVQGLQFVNKAGSEYNCWNSQIAKQNLTEAYFDPDAGVWYKQSSKETEIKEAEIQHIYVLAGAEALTGKNWSIAVEDNEKNILTQDGNTYSVTYTNVSAGTYEYKILQDPENKGWDLPWGDGNNRSITLAKKSDVTFSIDLTDDTKSVHTTITEVEGESGETVTNTFIVHMQNGKNWSNANIKFGSGSSWDVIEGYEDAKNNEMGVPVAADAVNTEWFTYTAKLPGSVSEVDGLFNNGAWGPENQTANFAIPVSKDTEVWITFTDASASNAIATSTAAPEGWLSDTSSDYTYNIYYYDSNDAHMSVDAAAIHVWEVDGPTLEEQAFDELVELEDGNKWLKATIVSSSANIGFIPKSKGSWSWQTGDHIYNNTEESRVCNLYVVYGDDAHTYTQLPEVKEARKRTVIVEYNRPQGDYDGWNIYSWNTGLASETEIYTQDRNGKKYINVPVKDSGYDFDMAFCMRHSVADNKWEAKDGGDHAVTVPGNQVVVKAVFDQDKGITRVLPYNKGYEMNGAEKKITFLYRDDARMLTNEEASLSGKVSVVINGESHAMDYDAENERYAFELTNLASGDYAYYYVVDGEEVQDSFNTNKGTFDNKECSIVAYKAYDAAIEASLSSGKMDYEANNILRVSFAGDAGISTEEIDTVTADLTELGLGVRTISKELMATTIAVTADTSCGTKNIPVTLKDIYGNSYQTSVSVEVAAEDDASFDWDEAIIYFAVTDRFFDGNTDNNTGVNKDGSLSYHGGDFAGLTQKLDYLQELGVNTIWITPIVENSNTTTEKDGKTIESTGYHGYWASDFTKLNAHLGTEEEFAALIDAAHERGMKLMVDVVLNHSGYADAATGFDPNNYFDAILVNEETGETIPMLRDANHTVAGDDVYSSLAGLPDFLTEDARVRDQLIEWQVDWVEKYGIDYFRVDTVKHVNAEAWQAFKNALTEADSDFKMIGELSGHGYASSQLGIGGMDSLLDFDFNDQAQNFVTGNITGVETFMANRNAGINNTRTVGAFLSSHDENGLVYKLINDCHMSEEQALNAFKVAAALELTAKGQVVVYYGEEIGLYGADNYPYQTNRYDFAWDEADAQSVDENSMLNHYKKLLAVRNDYMELFARGDRNAIVSSNEEGYDVFARTYGDEALYVALNIKNAENSVSFGVDAKAGTTFVDLYSGKEYAVAADQTVTVTIPASANGGTVILAEKSRQDEQTSGGNTQKPEDKTETGNESAGNSGAGNDNAQKEGTDNSGNNGDNGNSGNSSVNGSLVIAPAASLKNATSPFTGEKAVGEIAEANEKTKAGARAEVHAETSAEADADAEVNADVEATVEADGDIAGADTAAEQEDASIADSEVPLAATMGNGKTLPVVFGIIVLLALAAGGVYYYTKKKQA